MLPDKRTQRKIWQRVYGAPPRQQPRSRLLRCRARAVESLGLYRFMEADPVYGPAYARLAELCKGEIALLDGLLGSAP